MYWRVSSQIGQRPGGVAASANWVPDDLHGADLVGEPTVGRVHLDCGRFNRCEAAGERWAERGLQRKRRPVVNDDVPKARDGPLTLGR
jgi:hypothetical protein